MHQLFPNDHVVVGLLLFIVGFLFHWVGQLISVINWDYAVKIGLQESNMPKEFKVYEQAIALADSLIGWLYGVIAFGLFFQWEWCYRLTWIPGGIFIYHSISYWYWTRNRRQLGYAIESRSTRVVWTIANLITGILTIAFAWSSI